MVINRLKWITKSRLAVTVLCAILATACLMFMHTNQVAEAAILTPVDSATLTPVFSDDFSGDLSSWNVASGTWGIESGELSGETSAFGDRIIVNALNVDDFTAEYKIRFVSSTYYEVGLVFRAESLAEPNNCYWVGIKSAGLFLHEKKSGASLTLGSYPFTPSLAVNYIVKVSASGQSIKIWLDGDLRIDTSNADFASGSIGFMAWSANSEHAHIDYLNVSEIAAPTSTAYSLKVRAGTTQITTTCSWSGSGNLTILNVTTPSTTYYESDMSIYEKTKISFDGTTNEPFNIKRAVLSITSTVSEETWTLNLNLTEVTTYEVSVEIS